MAYKDEELTLEELDEITAGVTKGKTIEMLEKLGLEELKQFRSAVTQEKELSSDELTEEELDNVKAGIPLEAIEKLKGKL